MSKEDRYHLGLFLVIILIPIIVVFYGKSEELQNNTKNCNKACYPSQVLVCNKKYTGCADNTIHKVKH